MILILKNQKDVSLNVDEELKGKALSLYFNLINDLLKKTLCKLQIILQLMSIYFHLTHLPN